MISLFPSSKLFFAIDLGSFHLQVTWYAILILGGALLAYFLSIKEAKKRGYDKEILENFFLSMLPIAIVGARLYYVIFEWSTNFAYDPISAFYVWEGGLAIHGGLIAAIIYAYFYFRHYGINLLRVGDCIMPNILIAQVIGRWGNFINQEAYGEVVSGNYFKYFPDFIKDNMFIDGAYRMPMFLYEGIGNLIGFFLIKFVFKKYGYRKRGDMVYAYIAWYGMVRFFVEMFRTDALMLGGLRVAQITSLIFVTIGLLGIFGVYNKVFKKIYPFTPQKPVILFDADGTLIDTEKLIMDSFRHTFAHFKPDYTLGEEELHSFMGPTLRATFEKYFPEEQVDEVVNFYREFNHREHDAYVKEIPHAKEVLSTLKKDGYTVGVVSNKMEALVRRGLHVCELEEYMDTIIGCDGVTNPKPHPESLLLACKNTLSPVDDVIYVGDTPGDVQAAKNMCAYSIALVSNECGEAKLKEAKPCALIYDLREILEIVKEENEWDELVI